MEEEMTLTKKYSMLIYARRIQLLHV